MIDNKLYNQKILLIIFPFYKYHLRIEEELRNFGYHVSVLYNQFDTTYAFSQNRISFFIRKCLGQIHKVDISSYLEEKYDFVLSLGGYSFPKFFLEKLKRNNPSLKTIIYFWDSLRNWKNSDAIDWFDIRFSFDLYDCLKYKKKNLQHLPLFYLDNTILNKDINEPSYNITYIGSLSQFSQNRLSFLKRLQGFVIKNNLSAFLFLYCSEMKTKFSLVKLFYCITNFRYFKYYLSLLFNRQEPFINNQMLSLEKVETIKTMSQCVVDICVKKQTGVSIGVIDTLSRGKKIVTTNKYIKHENFYSLENIFILDKKSINGLLDFISAESVPIDISYLQIRNWLKKLLMA
jgi:hypothetical protein